MEVGLSDGPKEVVWKPHGEGRSLIEGLGER